MNESDATTENNKLNLRSENWGEEAKEKKDGRRPNRSLEVSSLLSLATKLKQLMVQ